jgi:hypothetical protein
MRALPDRDVGETVYEAGVYYDDGDNPVAEEGPSGYATDERTAEAFAQGAARPAATAQGGFWHATIRRGRVVDSIGDGRRYDHSFEPDPGWSRTPLGDDEEEKR